MLEGFGLLQADRGTYNAAAFRTALEYAKAMLEPGEKNKICHLPHTLALCLTVRIVWTDIYLCRKKKLLQREEAVAGLNQEQLEICAIESYRKIGNYLLPCKQKCTKQKVNNVRQNICKQSSVPT